MAYAGEWEDRGRHALFGCATQEPSDLSEAANFLACCRLVFTRALALAEGTFRRFWLAGSRCRHDKRQNAKHAIERGDGDDSGGSVRELKKTPELEEATIAATLAKPKLAVSLGKPPSSGLQMTGGEMPRKRKGALAALFSNVGTKLEAADRVRTMSVGLFHARKLLLQHVDTHHAQETFVNRLFRDVYAPFLLTKRTIIYVALAYIVYISIAIWGISSIKEGLNPRNLVRSSFYLSDFYTLIDETFWNEGASSF